MNRELSKLRRMFNIAQREGWVRKNPFAAGESLISMADEGAQAEGVERIALSFGFSSLRRLDTKTQGFVLSQVLADAHQA